MINENIKLSVYLNSNTKLIIYLTVLNFKCKIFKIAFDLKV